MPTVYTCTRICETTLSNITSELIFVTGGVNDAIADILETLKARITIGEDAVNSKEKFVEEKTHSTVSRVDELTKPVEDASRAFLDDYSNRLRNIAPTVAMEPLKTTTMDKQTSSSMAASTKIKDSSPAVVQEGASLWLSSAVAVVAVLVGAAVERRRSAGSRGM